MILRLGASASLLGFGEAAALACSCGMGSPTYTARQVATEASIVGEFEVVEQADHAKKRGELLRPVRTYVGTPQRTYRLKYSGMEPCTSSLEKGRIVILYRDWSSLYEESGMPREPNLAHELGEVAKAADPKRRLAWVRRKVAARRLDASAAVYEDAGICLQLALHDPGALDLLRQEAARAGRRVPR